MSQENVEIVRRIFDAFSRADAQAALGEIDAEVEWRAVEDTETQRGHEGVVRSLVGWFETWDDHRLEAEEFIDLGDQVLVVAHLWARGRESGAEIDDRYFQLWTIEGEKVVVFREYRDRAEALAAVGLSD
jgi:ketosteroid isomerase-like protein